MYEFAPAGDPVSALWSPGTFRAEVPVPRGELIRRVADSAISNSIAQSLLFTRSGIVAQVGQDRVRIWRSSYWRRSPARGATLIDARLQDWGSMTVVTGRIRLGYPYLLNLLAVAAFLVLVFGVGSNRVWSLYIIVPVILIQFLIPPLAGRRDARMLLDFLEALSK